MEDYEPDWVTERLEAGLTQYVPDYMRGDIRRYVLFGVAGGSFLNSLFSNNLMGAFGNADITNLANMQNYFMLLYNCVPCECYRSPEAVAAWCASGGYLGQRENSGASHD